MGKPDKNGSNIFMMVMDGHVVGRLKSVDGGFTKNITAAPRIGRQQGLTRSITDIVDVTPFVVEMAAEIEMLKWIQSTFRKGVVRHSISIYRALLDGSSVFELDGYDCLIKDITMPRLESGSKAKMYLRLTIVPERTVSRPIKDTRESWPPEPQKWLTTNGFQLEIDTLPNLGGALTAIEAFTIKQGIARRQVGESRFAENEPTKVEFPNLHLTLTGTAPKAFREWLDQGSVDPSKRILRTGALHYLTASGAIAFSLNLYDVLPMSIAQPGKSGTGPMKVQLAVGRMDLDGTGGLGLE